MNTSQAGGFRMFVDAMRAWGRHLSGQTIRAATPSDSWVSLIVDTREGDMLPDVVRQHVHMARLPLVFVCGPSNRGYVESKVLNSTPNSRIVQLDRDICSKEQYSSLMTGRRLWTDPAMAGVEKVLVFQWDTMLRKPLRKRHWADVDYVGAPWLPSLKYPMGADKPSIHLPFGGNGGLSIRSIAAMLATPPSPNDHYVPEDIWYSVMMRNAGFRVAGRQVGGEFASEAIETDDPFGLHAPWMYFNPSRLLVLPNKGRSIRIENG